MKFYIVTFKFCKISLKKILNLVINCYITGAKSYVFELNKSKSLRIIDTPGLGDTRGILQDDKNFEETLEFISKFSHLHAICILVKPNNSRLNVLFKYCINQLLSRLEKTAANNMVFIFTHSRSTFYKPDETKAILETHLKKIKLSSDIEIPFNKDNIFCVDNEAFRFLISIKNGVKFNENEKKMCIGSWNQSVNESLRFLKYVNGENNKQGLIPHKIQDTLSVNNTRRWIVLLSKPLGDISQLIQDNIQIMSKHKEKIESCKRLHKDMENQLYIPCVNLRMKELSHPATVCAAKKCMDIVMV